MKTKTYENCPLYNKGKDFQRVDANRLFYHLILKRVLSKKLIVGDFKNVIPYVMLGPTASELLMKKTKVSIYLIS